MQIGTSTMKNILKNEQVKSLLGNISILFTGTILAQVVTMAATPILSRLYGPEAFGELGVFTSLLSIAGVAVTMRYDQAIVVENDDKKASDIFKLGFISVLLVTCITAISIFSLSNVIITNYKIQNTHILYFLPITLFVTGLFALLQAVSLRRGSFKLNSASNAIRSLTVAGVQTCFGFNWANSIGLIFGQFTGVVLALLVLGHRLKHDTLNLLRDKVSFKELKKTFINYKEYPLYGTPQALTNSISQNIPMLMLGSFFGIKIVGLYLLPLKLLQLPVTLFGGTTKQAFLKKIADCRKNNHSILKLYKTITLLLLAIGLVLFGFTAVFSQKIFTLFLGNEWITSGTIAMWLSLWLCFAFINPPSTAYLYASKQIKWLFVYECILLALRVTSIAVGAVVYNDAIISIALFSISGAVCNLALVMGTYIYISRAET